MKKYMIYAGIIAALVCVTVAFGHAYKTPSVQDQEAHFAWEPIVEKLRAKSEEYERNAGTIKALQDKIADLEGRNALLAQTATDYDSILCVDYGVRFNRAGSGSVTLGCQPSRYPAHVAPPSQGTEIAPLE